MYGHRRTFLRHDNADRLRQYRPVGWLRCGVGRRGVRIGHQYLRKLGFSSVGNRGRHAADQRAPGYTGLLLCPGSLHRYAGGTAGIPRRSSGALRRRADHWCRSHRENLQRQAIRSFMADHHHHSDGALYLADNELHIFWPVHLCHRRKQRGSNGGRHQRQADDPLRLPVHGRLHGTGRYHAGGSHQQRSADGGSGL